VRADLLPDLSTAWATAHVQCNNFSFEGDFDDSLVHDYIKDNPGDHCSRLMCLRKLEPETQYYLFLVPNYKAAVNAALGITGNGVGDQDAWQATDDYVKLPVYFASQFSTSEAGDFESLARALVPTPVDGKRVGFRAVNMKLVNEHEKDPNIVYYLLREGALAAPGFSANRDTFLNIVNHESAERDSIPPIEDLKQELNASLASEMRETAEDEDPLVTLPVYGRYYRSVGEVKAPTGNTMPQPGPWLHELNLDRRQRMAAGFGTEVIRKNEQKYVLDCWKQVGKLRQVNQIISRYKTGFIFGDALKRKHIDPLSDKRFAMLMIPFRSHVSTTVRGAGISFKQAFTQSGVTRGVLSAPFLRIAHKKINIRTTTPFIAWIKADSCCGERIYHEDQKTIVIQDKELYELSGQTIPLDIEIRAVKPEVIPVSPINLGRDYRPKFNLKQVLHTKLTSLIRFNNGRLISPDFDPIIISPKLADAMYRPLADISHDYVLPGIEFLKNDGISLLEENRRFIAAYMCGLNHEMVGELVWSSFPVHKQSTIFNFFWDPTMAENPLTDIPDINQWRSPLGHNGSGPPEGSLVLVIKGDLIRRYPGTIIYAIKVPKEGTALQYWSEAFPEDNPPIPDEIIIQPIFRATIGADIQFAGFPFTKESISGTSRDAEYYFVLQENQLLPRFGLDVQSVQTRRPDLCGNVGSVSETDDPCTADDLSWSDVALDEISKYLNQFDSLAEHAAQLAGKTHQKPMRVIIHSSLMLESESGE
jgi:hypothetical protein